MQSYTSFVVEAVEEASIGKEQKPERERASYRRRGTQKLRIESSFQKGVIWERGGQQQQWKGEGEEGRTAAFPSCILTEFFSEMPVVFLSILIL